jgi:hypothetical protein
MRVEVKVVKKKEDGVGVGFLIAFAALCGIAYVAGSPDNAARFPPSVERSLTNYRTQVDGATEGVRRSFSNAYATVAGR